MSETTRMNLVTRFDKRLGEHAEDLWAQNSTTSSAAARALESVRLALRDAIRDVENAALIYGGPDVDAIIDKAIVLDPPQTAQEDVRDDA